MNLTTPATRMHPARFATARLIGLAAAVALLVTGCVQSLFYHPDRVVYDNPGRTDLDYEPVAFRSKDGTRLAGWFIPAPGYAGPRNAKGTVIHFHGNAQNMSAHWRFVEWAPRRGFNLFVFDYRGYGESEGTPDPAGVFEDSMSAVDYVRMRADVDTEKLLLLGQSLGGANAIAVLGSGNRKGVKAIVVEATFYSYSSIASDKVPGAGMLMDDTYSPERFVAGLSPVPFMLLHGTADPVIPFAHAAKLYGRAGEPRRLVTIEGAGHIEAFGGRFGTTYSTLVGDFFEAALRDN